MAPTPALHTSTKGEGTPVVLLHSGGMSSRQWRKLREALATEYRVIAPDFLGVGGNPPWPEDTPFHFSADVDAIVALLDTLDTPAHLVGHSYGGWIALNVARQRPALLRSLVVYDPVAFGLLHDAHDDAALADLARAEQHPAFRDPAQRGSEAWMEAFIDYWSGVGSWRALPEPARRSFLTVGKKVAQEVHTLLADRTPRSAYAQLAVPALVMTGEASPDAAKHVVALLAASLPHATLTEIPGAGHMGPVTHGDAVNAAIAAHLARSSSIV